MTATFYLSVDVEEPLLVALWQRCCGLEEAEMLDMLENLLVISGVLG